MDELQNRLAECFFSIFPDLTPDSVGLASAASMEGWDSVATISLLTIIEEEFGISIEIADLTRFNSFQSILEYIRQVSGKETSSSR